MAKYRNLAEVAAALMKVPAVRDENKDTGSKYMSEVKAHSFTSTDGEDITVAQHYKYGQLVNGVVVNIHFYGFDKDDLGRKHVCDVKIVEKTREDGQKFIHIDAQKSTVGKPTTRIKFLETGKRTDSDIYVLKSAGKGYIHFEPIAPRVPETETTTGGDSAIV